jgi:transposase
MEALNQRRMRAVAAPRKYPEEIRDRAMRLADDMVESSGISQNAACRRVGEQLGIPGDTVRNWFRQGRVDAGKEPGLTSADRARIAELERENRELRRANAILKSASAFFAAELDRPSPR